MTESDGMSIDQEATNANGGGTGSKTNVKLDDITKIFQDDEEGKVVAVDDLSLDILDGEFLVFVGPSGCGKTTTLRTVAGLETPTEGQVIIDDEDVTGQDPRQRNIAMVFQNYALYPHKTVRQNMSFPLEVRNYPPNEITERVEDAAELLDITELLERRPKQLSGGQQQRVALGRAIVREPDVFLLDEPLSNLDAKLRLQMRTELNELHQKVGKTTIYVTHDQAEAMTLGDRVAVMRDGEIQQVGPPQMLYDNPVNLFVGGFIGEPPMNFFPVDIEDTGDGYTVSSVHFDFQLPDRFAQKLSERDSPLGEAILGIRPEDISDAEFVDETEGYHVFDSRVKIVEPLGSDKFLTMIDPEHDPSEEPITSAGTEGEIVTQATEEFTVRVPPESTAREGELLRIAMEFDSLHLFDASTGKNILSDKRIHYKKDSPAAQ
ncbi:ABC transporter ATP-binding protein [Haloplanus litoreus]|uniref:ABC-type D-xylose/L-arabinose transporter n=1 Tax=Haloplanus litoreus TaxID=767515 RepID=A0ABD6A1D5_9EURY